MNLSNTLTHLSLFYTHQPLRYVVNRLLRSNRISVEEDMLEQRLSKHPYFPSLLSVSDVLNELGIAHKAYRTDLPSLMDNFNNPVLVFLTTAGGMFGVVERIFNGKVKVFTEKGDNRLFTVEEFQQNWDGVVLELDKSDQGAVRHQQMKGRYPALVRYLLLAGWFLVFFYLLQQVVSHWPPAQVALLFFSLAGAGSSWILLLQHLNKNNMLVRQMCDSGTNVGCHSVLGSSASQLTSWLSMAEAGLMFFAGTFVLLFFFEMPLLYFYLALLAPLFSVYAIYLQAFVIRQWCKLCMLVHGVLLINLVIAGGVFASMAFKPGLPPLSEILAFLVPAFIWMGVKPTILTLKEGNLHKKLYRRLKADPDLFKALLAKQPRIHIPSGIKLFSFGDPEAANELVFVSNPFCGPCARAHGIIHEWLENEPDFRITVIFFHNAAEDNPKRQFVEMIAGITDKERLKEVLHNWFEDDHKDLEKWSERYGLEKSPLSYEDGTLTHWLELANVRATPAFFINGRPLPDSYRLEEIRYLVSEAQ